MSMITCPECQSQISSMATACPKCGCPVQAAATPAANPSPAGPGSVRKIVAVCALLIVGLALWWVFSVAHPSVPSPAVVLPILSPPAQKIDETLIVGPGYTETYRLTIPRPGHFSGFWSSAGKSAGIAGAQDDTLVGYVLRSPDNQVLDRLDHPTSGNFDVRCTSPGIYTFEFSNAGIIRMAARKVEIHGTYQPD